MKTYVHIHTCKCVCVCVCVRAQLLCCVQLFETPWTAARQAPLSMGFFRQEYQNRLSFPPPGDLANLGIEPPSPAPADRFFTTKPPEKLKEMFMVTLFVTAKN